MDPCRRKRRHDHPSTDVNSDDLTITSIEKREYLSGPYVTIGYQYLSELHRSVDVLDTLLNSERLVFDGYTARIC